MEIHFEDIVKALPEIIKYFIPGYICLRIKEIYRYQREHSKFTTIIMSLLYSFIVLAIFTVIKNVLKPTGIYSWLYNLGNEDDRQIIKCVCFVALGCALGIILSILQRFRLFDISGRLINGLYSPSATPWVRTMTLPYGSHMKVTLKNGKQYVGNLEMATGDPDDPNKEILLNNYSVSKNNDVTENNTIPQDSYEKIRDEMKKNKEKYYNQNEWPIIQRPLVLLKYADIETIEVIPVSRKIYKMNKNNKKQKREKREHNPANKPAGQSDTPKKNPANKPAGQSGAPKKNPANKH